jgi:hypothetical protein
MATIVLSLMFTVLILSGIAYAMSDSHISAEEEAKTSFSVECWNSCGFSAEALGLQEEKENRNKDTIVMDMEDFM